MRVRVNRFSWSIVLDDSVIRWSRNIWLRNLRLNFWSFPDWHMRIVVVGWNRIWIHWVLRQDVCRFRVFPDRHVRIHVCRWVVLARTCVNVPWHRWLGPWARPRTWPRRGCVVYELNCTPTYSLRPCVIRILVVPVPAASHAESKTVAMT